MLDHPGLLAWQAQINDAILGQKIEKIRLLQVNTNYLGFDENALWVLDAGAEITLQNGSKFTFGWDSEVELMNFILDDASILLKDVDYYELEEVTQKVHAACVGKTIKTATFEWNWYQMMDDNFELEEALHFAPLGLILQFEEDAILQLASIKFGVQDQTLANASYLPEGDLLVNISQILPIHLDTEVDE